MIKRMSKVFDIERIVSLNRLHLDNKQLTVSYVCGKTLTLLFKNIRNM